MRVGTRVGDDQKSWLPEVLCDLIGEGTWGVALCVSLCASVRGELQYRASTVWACRYSKNIGWVFDGNDDAGCQMDFLPGLANVDDVNTVGTSSPYVVGHGKFQVTGTDVAFCRQHLFGCLLREGLVQPYFCYVCSAIVSCMIRVMRVSEGGSVLSKGKAGGDVRDGTWRGFSGWLARLWIF